jgi:carbamoyltransferase
MNILGISAFYHEAACCLLRRGELVAAAAEERFSRLKHDPRLPVNAFRFCLEAGGLDITDLSAIAFYEQPLPKLARQIWAGAPEGGDPDLSWLDPHGAERALREGLGWDGPILFFPHHLSHAASAYYFSGFPEAAVLTVDGVGEWATTTFGRGRGGELEVLAQVEFPHSLGLLYSAITAYLGFRVNGGEGQVMGLAPYGQPRHADTLRRLVRPDAAGFRLDLQYFGFVGGPRMFSAALEELLGQPPRPPGGELKPFHSDLARSVQLVLEEQLLALARRLAALAPSDHLCLAGGVALNCVANGRLLREAGFKRVFVPPAPGDQGACLGAALLAHRELTGETPLEPLRHAFWGPEASGAAELLAAAELPALDFRGREAELTAEVAQRLAAGQVVGWVVGRAELGPRALGGRSILADPRNPMVRDHLNHSIKRRETFRPFAPAVLAEHAAEHFDLPPGAEDLARFMLITAPVISPRRLPAITHVDGSARVQIVEREHSPRFAALLDAFHRRTGCPVLLNTSLNVAGNPIATSALDALQMLADAGLDALVLDRFLLEREQLPPELPALVARLEPPPPSPFRTHRGPLDGALYTFV